MRVNGLWKFNQRGFKADHRIEDNLFILNTIYDKYINMENKQFIRPLLTHFFDTVHRKFLLHKLLRYNITENVYDFIKSMYSNTFR